MKQADPKPQVVDEHWQSLLGGRSPSRGGRVPAPHRAPQPRGPVLGRGVPTSSVSENQRGHLPILVRWKVAGNPDALLNGLHTDSLICQHSLSLQWRGSNSRGARDIREKTEFCGFRARAGGRAAIIPRWRLPHL